MGDERDEKDGSRSRSRSRTHSRSSTPRKSRSKEENGDDDDRRRDDDRRKDDDRRRNDDRRRDSGRRKDGRYRRSRSTESPEDRRNIDQIVKEAIAANLQSMLSPIQQQLSKIGAADGGSDVSSEIQILKAKQERLDVETKASALNTSGAQSQYRCIAGLKLNMKDSLLRLEEALLLCESPDDPVYAALAPIRESLNTGISNAEERLGLIVKADADPKSGWLALTMFEGKLNSSKIDPEKEKVFQSCLKEVQEDRRKKEKPSRQSSFRRPFSSGPGQYSGNFSASSYSGICRVNY